MEIGFSVRIAWSSDPATHSNVWDISARLGWVNFRVAVWENGGTHCPRRYYGDVLWLIFYGDVLWYVNSLKDNRGYIFWYMLQIRFDQQYILFGFVWMCGIYLPLIYDNFIQFQEGKWWRTRWNFSTSKRYHHIRDLPKDILVKYCLIHTNYIQLYSTNYMKSMCVYIYIYI